MFMCEECNYIWEEKQRYIGDPETTHCPECGSAEIEETRPQNLAQPDAYSLLSEVRAVLEDIVEGEYRLFHSDSMDQDTGLEEKIKNLYKKVSEHFS